MKLAENSILSFILRTNPGCRNDRYYIPHIQSYIDGMDISILNLVACGVNRDDIATELHRTRRTIEQRLQNVRALFKCRNTNHLIATLAFIPMDIHEAFKACV